MRYSIFSNRLCSISAFISLAYAFICVLLSFMLTTEVLGINAFIKPMKFGLSAALLFLTFSWFSSYLPTKAERSFKIFAWVNCVVMTFELSWILIQAYQGTLSHFNVSSYLEGIMFGIMGVAIAISTAWTLTLFKWTFHKDFKMHSGLLWSIRFGILYFVFFGFTGFIMGANQSHTVGAVDGGPGLPILNWSLNHGDLRIPHFFGLHSLQILPLLASQFKLSSKGGMVISSMYGLVCMTLLYLALKGQTPF